MDFQVLDIDSDGEIIRLFGRSSLGKGVMITVNGFQHYFYCDKADGETANDLWDGLNRRTRNSVSEVVEVTRQSIMYAHSQPKPVFKVIVSSPDKMAIVKQQANRRTYEANLPFVLRFMIDLDIQGACWITVPNHTIKWDQIKAHSPNDRVAIADLRILSFDIECAGRRGIFPTPEQDSVIQIACIIGSGGRRVIFVLRSCDPIDGVQVKCFENETDLLLAFAEFVRTEDPDVITGYNILGFDLPYLLDRANELGIGVHFSQLGRDPRYHSSVKTRIFQSRQSGARENKEVIMPGRVLLDMIKIVQQNFKLRSYTLNSVSAQFLGSQKEDVHHSEITPLFNGDSATRRRLAVYCVKDAELPLQLMQKLMVIPNQVEMSRVTGVPMSYILTRGQQIKVFTQLLRKARSKDIIVPDVSNDKKRAFGGPGGPGGPEITLTPSGAKFVKSSVRAGLLPEILTELLAARKKAKNLMKDAPDEMTKAILDGRQLALKVCANSVYGFTGATEGGMLPLMQIASSVTSFGREMIELVKSTVEREFVGSVVVYGDTDSVMIKFGTESVTEAMDMAKLAAEMVTAKFQRPISMVFEKASFYIILFVKCGQKKLFLVQVDMKFY